LALGALRFALCALRFALCASRFALRSSLSDFSVSAFSPVGPRQVQKAAEFHRAGLLSKEGLAKVQVSGLRPTK